MAVLYVFEATGNPADLLAKYDDAGRAWADKRAQQQSKGVGADVIAHVCIQTSDGIRILDLLEGVAPLPKGTTLPKGAGVEFFQQSGLVDAEQRSAARKAGLLDVNYSETVYNVHDFSVFKMHTP
jgi:hypothetical protein